MNINGRERKDKSKMTGKKLKYNLQNGGDEGKMHEEQILTLKGAKITFLGGSCVGRFLKKEDPCLGHRSGVLGLLLHFRDRGLRYRQAQVSSELQKGQIRQAKYQK
jgi:hypothetical protein